MDYDIPEAYISSIGSPGVAGIKDGSQATAWFPLASNIIWTLQTF
jgi:hypothetical protein